MSKKLKVLRTCFVGNYLWKEGLIIGYDPMLASYEKNFAVVGEGEKPVEVAVKEEPHGLSEYAEKPVVLQPDGIDRMTHAQLKEKAKSMGLKFQGNPSFDSLKKAIKEAGK